MAVSPETCAIIVAGGSGNRFGGKTPKQFLTLGDQPLLLWTLQAFEAAPSIDAICAAAPAASVSELETWREIHGLKKLQWVIAGGKERQDSTRCGFKALPPCELVLVHDGARPLVSRELIERVVTATRDKGAAVPGLPVQETLKKVAVGGHVLTTVDRQEYATIQTPQGFRYALLAEALDEAAKDSFYGTDEAMLIERMGFPVCMVTGERDNIKITAPADMSLAEAILARRVESV